MKTKIFSIFALFLVMTLQAQKQPATVSAVINPVEFNTANSNDDPFTIITWNDASSVTGIEANIWGFDFDMIEDEDYTITPINGLTSRLTFISAKAKSQSKNDDIVCTISFNVGNPAVFTIITTATVEYGVLFWVIDNEGGEINDAVMTFNGVAFAPGDYDAGMYLEGIYNYTFTKQGYYMVHGAVTVDNPISQTIVMYPESNTGIGAQVNTPAKAYPNPATTIFNMEFEGATNRTIKFFTLDGRLVKELNTTAPYVNADIKDLANGTYMLVVKSDAGTETLRMIKQ